MATVYEIVQGLSQAAANAYDGATTDDGEQLNAGLQREEGDPILDKRVMDGFGVRFYGNMMCLTYHSEVQLKEVYASGFEGDVEQRVADIASFLKKEYKAITGDSLSLKEDGPANIHLQHMSRVRSWVQANKVYAIGGIPKGAPGTVLDDSQRDFGPDRLKGAIEKWLAIGKDKYPKTKKPRNVTRKGEQ